jgi:protein ImuA
MARSAAARETVCALRREIARIEGVLPERLEPVAADGQDTGCGIVRRRSGMPEETLLRTGVKAFDAALGGGLPRAALTEFHGPATRDAGASAGLALAFAALDRRKTASDLPLLWIGTTEIFREAGMPYALGLAQSFGLGPEALLFAQAPKLTDALWIAEEAARLPVLSAVILELRGNPERLDLTATRRLHRRAADAGRPVFLLRQGAQAEPTAAPVRLAAHAAPAVRRGTLAGPLPDSVGAPAFFVSVDKSPIALPGRFVLEWNRHDLAFQAREPALPRHLVSESGHGADLAPAPRTVVAFGPQTGDAASGGQPPREQRAQDFGTRRAG